MTVNAGQLLRLQVDGEDFDPKGDFTVVPDRQKREHTESTQRGNHYYRQTKQPGKVTGQAAIRSDQDSKTLTDADKVSVLIETPSGKTYRGTMTYVADGEETINEGDIQVELSGSLQEI